jgi:hypothetical protein
LLAAIAGEVWLTWALVKTYSRGALAGLGAAGVVMLAGQVFRVPRSKSPGGWRGLLLAGGLRLVLLVFCLYLSDGFERVAPEYVNADKSVLNRLDLWRGGLELVALRPLAGWGLGNAGQSFMNWTQPIGREEGYKSMVNSYLTVAVEGGLPLFGLMLFAGGAVVAMGVWLSISGVAGVVDPGSNLDRVVGRDRGRRPRLQQYIALAATGGVVGWAGCIFFSNLWIFPGLWVVPGISAVVVVSLVFLQSEARTTSFSRPGARVAFTVAVAAVVTCATLWATGSLYTGREALNVTVEDNTVFLTGKSTQADDPGILVLPDMAVLGDRPGQELRRWVQADPSRRLIIPLAQPTPVQIKSARLVVAFGKACGNPDLAGAKVILIHPYETPPTNSVFAKGSVLMLPGIDLAHQNDAWRDWAGTQPGMEVKENAATALDIRVRWPEVMLRAQRP